MQEQQKTSNELHFTRYFAHQQSVNVMDEVKAIKEQRETMNPNEQDNDPITLDIAQNDTQPQQAKKERSFNEHAEDSRLTFALEHFKATKQVLKKKEKKIHLISTLFGIVSGMVVSAFFLHLATMEPLMLCRVLMLLAASFAWIPVTWILGEAGSEFLKVTSFRWMTLSTNVRIFQQVIPIWRESNLNEEDIKQFIDYHELHCYSHSNLNQNQNNIQEKTQQTRGRTQLMSHASNMVDTIKQWRFKKD